MPQQQIVALMWEFGRKDPELLTNNDFTCFEDSYLHGKKPSVEIVVPGAKDKDIPMRLFVDPDMGPKNLRIKQALPAGDYTFSVQMAEAEARTDVLFEVDKRTIAQNRLFWSLGKTKRIVEHRYPFTVGENGIHHLNLEAFIGSRTGVRDDKSSLSLLWLALYRGTEWGRWEPFSHEHPGQVVLDMWGFEAMPWWMRTTLVGPNYFRRRMVDDLWKWGGNSLQWAPSLIYVMLEPSPAKKIDGLENQRKKEGKPPRGLSYWTDDDFRDVTAYAHERGFIVEEKIKPPHNFARCLSDYRIWRPRFGNVRSRGWEHSLDGYTSEEAAMKDKGLFTGERNFAGMNHLLWSYNSGAFLAITRDRPNEGFPNDNAPFANIVDFYKGPNFAYAAAGGGKGYDDLVPFRYYFGHLGLHGPYNHTFVGYEADCRPLPREKGYGGRNYPDWFLKQIQDMFRPRAREMCRDGYHVHESSVNWNTDADRMLPEDVRDHVFAASQDPTKGCYAANLGTTGRDGTHYLIKTIVWEKGPDEPDEMLRRPRENRSASTAFGQNNILRIYRSALADCGTLAYDPEHRAHYDGNSLSRVLMDGFLRTEAGTADRFKRLPKPRIANDGSANWEVELNAGSHTLRFKTGKREAEVLVDVLVNESPVGRFAAPTTRGVHLIPCFTATDGAVNICCRPVTGSRLDDLRCDIRSTQMALETVWESNKVAASHRGVVEAVVEVENGKVALPKYLGNPKGPQQVRIYFDSRGVNYYYLLLTVRALRKGSFSAVANRDGIMNSPPGHLVTPGRAMGLAGEWALRPQDGWKKILIPCPIYSSGRNHLWLAAGEGDGQFETAEARLLRPPVRHQYPEFGGCRAVLEETSRRCFSDGARLVETRRYTLISELPYIRINVHRRWQGKSRKVSTVLDVPFHAIRRSGSRPVKKTGAFPLKMWLKDKQSYRPDILVQVEKNPNLLSWNLQGKCLKLKHADSPEEHFSIIVGVCPPGGSRKAVEAMISERDGTIKEMKLPRGKTLRVKGSSKGNRIVLAQVNDPEDGPYFVKENGWWSVRGAQPVYDRDEKQKYVDEMVKWSRAGCPDDRLPERKQTCDLVKLYIPKGKTSQIRKWGFIEDIVRPGYGCQNTLSIGSMGTGKCKVKVHHTTAYVFAPRILFKDNFSSVTVNGRQWRYFDDRMVFLPQQPGICDVRVSGKPANGNPHLARTAASVEQATWRNNVLSIYFGLPDFVQGLPEYQFYKALLRFDAGKYRVAKAEGAKIEKASKEGWAIIVFKPGRAKVHFDACL